MRSATSAPTTCIIRSEAYVNDEGEQRVAVYSFSLDALTWLGPEEEAARGDNHASRCADCHIKPASRKIGVPEAKRRKR